MAVLAHELGHWKLRHTPINFVAGMGLTAAQFCLLALVRSCSTLYEVGHRQGLDIGAVGVGCTACHLYAFVSALPTAGCTCRLHVTRLLRCVMRDL